MADLWIMNWEHVYGSVGVVMGVIGVYIGWKGWKRKRPTYVIRSNNIFSGLEHTIPEVEVRFERYGSPLTALTITKIAFWNAGTETINSQDVVKENPLSVRAKSGVVTYRQVSSSARRRTTKLNVCLIESGRKSGLPLTISIITMAR